MYFLGFLMNILKKLHNFTVFMKFQNNLNIFVLQIDYLNFRNIGIIFNNQNILVNSWLYSFFENM